MANLLKGTIYSREELTQVTATLRSLADDLEGICNGIKPRTPDTSVEEWFFGRKALPCLVGRIEGHPTLAGPYASTSQIFYFNEAAGLARTYTRWYRVGRPVLRNEEFQ